MSGQGGGRDSSRGNVGHSPGRQDRTYLNMTTAEHKGVIRSIQDNPRAHADMFARIQQAGTNRTTNQGN